MNAIIYSKPGCKHCVKAKSLLNEKSIPYREMIISPGFNEETLAENQQYVPLEQLLEAVPTAKTLPQIWLNDNYIGGYSELAAFFQND